MSPVLRAERAHSEDPLGTPLPTTPCDPTTDQNSLEGHPFASVLTTPSGGRELQRRG